MTSGRVGLVVVRQGHMSRALALIVGLLLVVPAAAEGNATARTGACPSAPGSTCLFYSGAGEEFDAYDFTADPSHYYFTPVRRDDNPAKELGASINPGGACTAGPAGSVKCPRPAAALIIDAAAGDDWLAKNLNCFCNLRLEVDMGPGKDLLRGSQVADTARGGTGDDFLVGYSGGDTLDGGPGNDEFEPGPGGDDVIGGEGYDVMVYWKGDRPVSVTLDDQPNDGEPGEGDNIRGDVEDVTGGDGNDTLTGNAAANVLKGDLSGDASSGNDDITGGEGVDAMLGQGGNDTLRARDGHAESVDCGPGADTAFVDMIDTVRACETVHASAELEPDRDRDGLAAPADCNDGDASIRPGAQDVPENGVDEDCMGGDAVNLDRDRDGIMRPADCDDGNAAIRPTAPEIPGNRVDENCDAIASPFTLPTGLKIPAGWDRYRDGTVLTGLRVTGLRSAAGVRIVCGKRKGRGKGPGCPFAAKRLKVRKGTANGSAALRRARLRTGAVLQVRVTTPGHLTLVKRFEFRDGRNPKVSERCQAPGSSTLRRCA